MKINSEIILSLTFFLTLLLKLVNLEIVPVRSTIYYSTTSKCVIYRENSEMCIDGEKLKSINGNNNNDIETINYSGKNYYEINLYNEANNNYINCIITYFETKNKLVFKYYKIYAYDLNYYNLENYAYYNESLDPLNKGINCQTRDMDFEFICFYMNKNKEVIQMNIKLIDNSYNVSIEYQVGKIDNSDDLKENDTLIMSSLFMGKYKFFYPENNFDFSIYVKEATEFNFSPNSVNSIRQFEFHKNDNNNRYMYFTFAIFKENYQSEWNDHLNEYERKILFFALQNEDQNPDVTTKYSTQFLDICFENKTNIFFLKIKEGIKDFQFEEIENENNANISRNNNFEIII